MTNLVIIQTLKEEATKDVSKQEGVADESTVLFSLAISDLGIIPMGSDRDGDCGILHYSEFCNNFYIQNHTFDSTGKTFELDSDAKQVLGIVNGVRVKAIPIHFYLK